MKQLGIMSLMLTLVLGCGRTEQAPLSENGRTEQAPLSENADPIVLDGSVEFTLPQRSTTSLPGAKDKVVVTIDDITRGQVMTTVSWLDGVPIFATQSLRQNDVVTFTVSNHVYKMKLKTLTNRLMGKDSATFQLSPATVVEGKALSETATIEALIASLKQLVGVSFIRNGKEYTLDEAITHMRKKWKWKKSEIKTAEDFIKIAASKSSTTGKPYKIKLKNGTEVNSETWFTEQLEVIRNNPNQH